MEYQVVVYSTDAVFARMLELEIGACGMTVVISEHPDAAPSCDTALLDLDSLRPPPAHTYRRMIGFTRDILAVEEEVQRQCLMILHRPFEMQALRREILVKEESTPTQPRKKVLYEHPQLHLHTDARVLELGGNRISLTPNELLVVSLLLEHRGAPVSREELARRIGVSDTNKTDVYVCYLRRKLSAVTPLPLIRTVRGKGYMIA